jgi:A/G-specific adenine glycosylase
VLGSSASSTSQPPDVPWVRRRLLGWGKKHFRAFEWRHDRDPYRTLITEVLLKQTGAVRVGTVRDRLLERYPSPTHLGAAEPLELRALINALGFANQRTDQLIRLGTALASRRTIPRGIVPLMRLPAVGPYTAAAVACFAFGSPEPALDVNVARIIARVFALNAERGEARRSKAVKEASRHLVSGRNSRRLNWALLDLGATICRPVPRCRECPLASHCASRAL